MEVILVYTDLERLLRGGGEGQAARPGPFQSVEIRGEGWRAKWIMVRGRNFGFEFRTCHMIGPFTVCLSYLTTVRLVGNFQLTTVYP